MHNMQLWSPKWQGTSFESLLKATRVDKSLATTLEQHFKLSLVRLRRHAILAKCINSSSKILVEAPSSSEKGADGQRGQRLAFGEASLDSHCLSCCLPVHSSLCTEAISENTNLIMLHTHTHQVCTAWHGLVHGHVLRLITYPATQFSSFNWPCAFPPEVFAHALLSPASSGWLIHPFHSAAQLSPPQKGLCQL